MRDAECRYRRAKGSVNTLSRKEQKRQKRRRGKIGRQAAREACRDN